MVGKLSDSEGSTALVWIKKMKALKEDPKTWNKGVFGNVAAMRAVYLIKITTRTEERGKVIYL